MLLAVSVLQSMAIILNEDAYNYSSSSLEVQKKYEVMMLVLVRDERKNKRH